MTEINLEVEPFKLQAADLDVSAYIGETNFVDIGVGFGKNAGQLRLTMEHDQFLDFAAKVVKEAQKIVSFKQQELENLKRADKVLAKMARAKSKKVNPGSIKKVKRKKRKWPVIND